MSRVRALATWSDGVLWRAAGWTVSGWILAGWVSSLLVETDRRALVGIWVGLYLPCWLSALWMWAPWNRVVSFTAASVVMMLVFAGRIASHAGELTPNGSETVAGRDYFTGVLALEIFGGLVWLAGLLVLRRRWADRDA